MSSMNRVTLLGHLGADPEVRQTSNGQPVTGLRIATNEVWNDKNGERQEKTEWHRVSVFGKQGETCAAYLTKGRQVLIEGRLQTREYVDKEGVKRWSTEIVANQVLFVGGGDRSRDGSAGADFGRRLPPPPPSDADGAFGFEDHDDVDDLAPTPAAKSNGRPLRVSGAASMADVPF